MILALIVGTLVGRFVTPFALGGYEIELGRDLRHRFAAAGHPRIAAQMSIVAIQLPDWLCAILFGVSIGRFIRRHTLSVACACGVGFTLLASVWFHAEVDFMWFRSQVMNWKFFLLLLQWDILSFLVLLGTAWITHSLTRRPLMVVGFPVEPVRDPAAAETDGKS